MIKKILVIDDHSDVRLLIKLALKFDNYEIHEAFDAQLGLKMVHAVKPDLILLDVNMPLRMEVSTKGVLNGLDLCRWLKSDAELSKIPVIFLSSEAYPEDIKAGMDVGADEYITKPFSLINLIEVIAKTLSKRAMA